MKPLDTAVGESTSREPDVKQEALWNPTHFFELLGDPTVA
jgi:hypothetical protein